MAPRPAPAIPAPMRPPMSAWLLDEGMPKYQVMRFYAIAPRSAARLMGRVTGKGSITFFPMVVGTATLNMNAPAKFQNAARRTAVLGLRTFVATTVAMEFAESWKPLMKSKMRATAMMIRTSARSAMLHHDGVDGIRHVLAFVDDMLQKLVDLSALHDIDGIP